MQYALANAALFAKEKETGKGKLNSDNLSPGDRSDLESKLQQIWDDFITPIQYGANIFEEWRIDSFRYGVNENEEPPNDIYLDMAISPLITGEVYHLRIVRSGKNETIKGEYELERLLQYLLNDPAPALKEAYEKYKRQEEIAQAAHNFFPVCSDTLYFNIPFEEW